MVQRSACGQEVAANNKPIAVTFDFMSPTGARWRSGSRRWHARHDKTVRVNATLQHVGRRGLPVMGLATLPSRGSSHDAGPHWDREGRFPIPIPIPRPDNRSTCEHHGPRMPWGCAVERCASAARSRAVRVGTLAVSEPAPTRRCSPFPWCPRRDRLRRT
jgi:hypothetical protein